MKQPKSKFDLGVEDDWWDVVLLLACVELVVFIASQLFHIITGRYRCGVTDNCSGENGGFLQNAQRISLMWTGERH